MASQRRETNKRPRTRPSTTLEGRENQLIALATNLVEKRLTDGSASAQETTHFLKLASTREKLEQRRMEQEIELQQAKIRQLESAERVEELYSKALNAMKSYAGQDVDEDTDEYDI